MNRQSINHSPSYAARFGVIATQFTIYFLSFGGALAATRILYELFFPRLAWLGRPFIALPLSAVSALVVWGIRLHRYTSSPRQPALLTTLTLFPLLLNLIYLANPDVDLVQSRFIFGGSLWVVGLLMVRQRVRREAWRWWGIGFVVTALLPVYWLTMSAQVGRDDVFEFQVVTPQLGIVHPTGYPLYLLLGRLFTLLPVSSVAWRLNFASAVYAVGACCLLFLLMWRLWKRPFPAVLGAVVIGVSPTLWSQAIVAEVYALNALIVAAAIYLIVRYLKPESAGASGGQNRYKTILLPAAVIGLGLTNHLTTVILLPAAALTVLLNRPAVRSLKVTQWVKVTAVLAAPLLLYAYLPLRWQAVVGEPMGYGRFVDWVIGGRFQGALQLMAWLRDPTRYEVVGRLFFDNWGWFNLAVALVGLGLLFRQYGRVALVLLVIWLGYTFYSLNYYVPDLAVFLIPAQLLIGIWWTFGFCNLVMMSTWRLKFGAISSENRTQMNADERGFFIQRSWSSPIIDSINMRPIVLVLLLLVPVLLHAAQTWPEVDQSADDGRTRWGTAVLDLPLAENGAILADSDKYPPLYYLQQTEGLRPDLDISVWPDEAAYRAQLEARLASGQTVYLARFLPGLEGVYHLRSVGPLTEVSRFALHELPASVVPADGLSFGDIRLLGYEIEPEAAVDGGQTAVTFYWQAMEPVTVVQQVYVRWLGSRPTDGRHPANNYYPTVAWEPGEIVPDYHLLPRPVVLQPETRSLQVALAAPFAPADDLEWQTVATVVPAPGEREQLERPTRARFAAATITGVTLPAQIRPQQPLMVQVNGMGNPELITFSLEGVGSNRLSVNGDRLSVNSEQLAVSEWPVADEDYFYVATVGTDVENGRYRLVAEDAGGAVCGWMQPVTTGCSLGEVEIAGVPIPPGATNFEDKIALLGVDIPDQTLYADGVLQLTLNWQSLASLSEDYTVFVQILDAQDRIVGQVDAWPLQGTYPTSQWTPGEVISDPYTVQLDTDLPPGAYRLQVGWYLLATLRRLPVLSEDGFPVDDKLLVPGLNAAD